MDRTAVGGVLNAGKALALRGPVALGMWFWFAEPRFLTYKIRQWPSISKLCGSETPGLPEPPDSFIPGEEFGHSIGLLEALSEAGSPRMKP